MAAPVDALEVDGEGGGVCEGGFVGGVEAGCFYCVLASVLAILQGRGRDRGKVDGWERGDNAPLASGNVILRNFIFRVSSSSEDVVGRSLVMECPLSECWLPKDGAREEGVMVATLVAAVATEATVGWRLKLKRPGKGLAGSRVVVWMGEGK